jgi:hypothetical protein
MAMRPDHTLSASQMKPMMFNMKHLLAPLAALALFSAQLPLALANEEAQAPEVPAIVKEMAQRLANCGVPSFKQFPLDAALPAPTEWTGSMEIPANDVRGVDTFTHTLIVHQPSNSAYVISTGGNLGGEVRGPIPLDWQCKKKPTGKSGARSAKSRK